MLSGMGLLFSRFWAHSLSFGPQINPIGNLAQIKPTHNLVRRQIISARVCLFYTSLRWPADQHKASFCLFFLNHKTRAFKKILTETRSRFAGGAAQVQLVGATFDRDYGNSKKRWQDCCGGATEHGYTVCSCFAKSRWVMGLAWDGMGWDGNCGWVEARWFCLGYVILVFYLGLFLSFFFSIFLTPVIGCCCGFRWVVRLCGIFCKSVQLVLCGWWNDLRSPEMKMVQGWNEIVLALESLFEHGSDRSIVMEYNRIWLWYQNWCGTTSNWG